MQFYLNGYRPGDPFTEDPETPVGERPGDLPEDVDVLIIGCGPAGLVLAAQLANFPDIRTAVIDRKDGPLQVGQADGVACRTVEMFEAFALADRLVNEAYWVNEVCFWRPDPANRTEIKRAGRIRDTEEGLSEFPHVIVNQARMLAYLRGHMERSAGSLSPLYGLHAGDLDVDTSGSSEYPVTVTLQHMRGLSQTGDISTIKARYVVGCDGARSGVRRAIGRELTGDITSESWGVMDVLAVTDFPDIRVKCAINSADQGNLLIIPREGGYLIRFYVELDEVSDEEMLEGGRVTPEKLTEVANRILHPYSVEVKDVGWWSVYEIGQRLCDKFDDVPVEEMAVRLPRVFIAGDACHTHSAKAGQGMNVSMADTWNLGWKLASVLRGTAKPELLHTYSAERQAVAKELIEFDREFSRRFTARARKSIGAEGADAEGAGAEGEGAGGAGAGGAGAGGAGAGGAGAEGAGADGAGAGGAGADPEEFQRYFTAQGRFTAGVATRYAPSMITAQTTFQHLAEGFPIGMRFHSAPVVRLADAKPVHLGHVAPADGAWRVYIFSDRSDPADGHSRVRELCEFLASGASPIKRFTPREADPDSVIDVRAIFQQRHRDLAVDKMPSVLLPRKGKFSLIDYEKMFCPDQNGDDIFELRSVNRETGCIVVVRPDQYVSHVLPLHAHDALADFFARILIDAR